MRMPLRPLLMFAAAFAISTAATTTVATAGDGLLDGNRYFYERYYAGEISSARTFLEAVVKQGRWVDRSDPLTIVDVRDASEFRAGHPEGAVHIPFPRIYQTCNENPDDPSDTVVRSVDGGACLYGRNTKGTSASMSRESLFLAFEARFPDKSARYALLCRTGSRSVRAGNILANPEKYLGPSYAGRGYSQVYNIWEGFVGLPINPVQVGTGLVIGESDKVEAIILDNDFEAYGFEAYKLDVNNDGVVDLFDYDGWRFHQGLPYVTRMLPRALSADAMPYYYMD